MNFNKSKTLGDKCKWFEKNFSPDIMIPELPVIIRLDGNSFHNWCKGLNKPFDDKLMELMEDTTKELVKETNAVIGYTQSDEITLILYCKDSKSMFYQAGKKQKILSKLTGICVNYFNKRRIELLPNHNKMANFDCRIYQVPTLEWACSQLLWRELDASKNSIQMLAQSLFPFKDLQGLHSGQLQDKMMLEKNVNWSNLPSNKKRGTYIKKDIIKYKFNKEEILKLPIKHHAHLNANLEFERTQIKAIELPIFSTIQDKVNVIFNQ